MTYLEEESRYLPEIRYWAQWGHNFSRFGYENSRHEFAQEVPEGPTRQEAYEAMSDISEMPEAKEYEHSYAQLEDGTMQRVVIGREIPGYGRPMVISVGTEQPPEVRHIAYRWRRGGGGPLKG